MSFDLVKAKSQLALPRWLITKLPGLPSSRLSGVLSSAYSNATSVAPPNRRAPAANPAHRRHTPEFRTGPALPKVQSKAPLHSGRQTGFNIPGANSPSFSRSLPNILPAPDLAGGGSRSLSLWRPSSVLERPFRAGASPMSTAVRARNGMSAAHRSNFPVRPFYSNRMPGQPSAATPVRAAVSPYRTLPGGSSLAPSHASQPHGALAGPIRNDWAEKPTFLGRSLAPARGATLRPASPIRSDLSQDAASPEQPATAGAGPTPEAENDTANASGEHATEIHIDGHALGQWMLHHLEQTLTRPPTTANFVMSHGMPTWPGQSPFV